MRNIIKICSLLILSILLLSSCKEKKEVNCDICGKKAFCYEVKCDKSISKRGVQDVCSKECEDVLKGLNALAKIKVD